MDQPDIEKVNPSKQKLMESGKALFYKHGYRRVSVEEVCRHAGVSKMTFYRFFDNKLDLIKALLVELAEDGVRIYREIMSRDIPFEEKIAETIRMKREASSQYSEEFMKDVYLDKESGILPLLKEMSAKTMALVLEDYRKAQEDGYLRQDLNLKVLPYFIGKLNEMINDPALLALYGDNLHEILREITNLFFYGIIVKNRSGQDEK
jgi:AcrR family transcriptional regulator